MSIVSPAIFSEAQLNLELQSPAHYPKDISPVFFLEYLGCSHGLLRNFNLQRRHLPQLFCNSLICIFKTWQQIFRNHVTKLSHKFISGRKWNYFRHGKNSKRKVVVVTIPAWTKGEIDAELLKILEKILKDKGILK